MDVDMTNEFSSIVCNRKDTIQKRKEYMEKAVKSWRYNVEFEPDKKRTPVKVDFNLNIKFAAACKAADFSDIKKYLDEGANINYVGPDGLTALHNAIIDNNVEIVKLLVENGSDVNIQDPMYWTPLHSAIEMGNLKIIQILLDNGADPSLMNSDEKLPIDLAKDDDIVRVIKKKMDDLKLSIDDLRTKERQSIRRDILKWYRDKKWDEKPHPLTGCYAIHVCAAKNYLPELYALVKNKICDINIKDYDGWTPLHGAVYWNNYDAAILLVKNDADIYAKTNINENILDICDTDETKILANDILNGNNELKEDIAKYELDKFELSQEELDTTEIEDNESISEPIQEAPTIKLKTTEGATTSNVIPNNENVDRYISGVPWDRTNKLKKVENSVKLFNAINANRCNVATSNQKITHDESESERKMISKQRRNARRSTRGITQDELKEVMNATMKKDELLFTSSSSSFEDSLNKLPFINSRSNVSKRSKLYINDTNNQPETISRRTHQAYTYSTSSNSQTLKPANNCLKDMHNQNEENGYNDLSKQQSPESNTYKLIDNKLLLNKPISFSQSFSPSTKKLINNNKPSEAANIAEKTLTEVSEGPLKDTVDKVISNDNISNKSSQTLSSPTNNKKDDDGDINYKALYLFEKEAHENLQKEFIKLQKENELFKQMLERKEIELQNSRFERDKLEQLKSENSALVRVLGKLTKEDGYKKN